MFGRAVTLFTIFGFKVKLDYSWVVIALFVSWSLATGYFPSVHEGLTAGIYWSMGIIGMFGIFFSIIFHELAHSLVARQYGLPIRGITLFIFGGVAEMEEEPKNAKTEFLMAIAGPLASLFLSGAFHLLAVLGRMVEFSAISLSIFAYLALINLVLGIFNLVPAFPLDGGRVLRAALWRWSGNIRWATRIASGAGSLFAFILMGMGALQIISGDLFTGLWWIFIGIFLKNASSSSYYQMITRRLLEGEPVSRFMTRNPVAVPSDLSISDLVSNYVYQHHHDLFPVLDGGRLLGSIAIKDFREYPQEEWPRLYVKDIMKPCSRANVIQSHADAMKALAIMQKTGNGQMMVTENGGLAGIITIKDMLKLLSLKIELEDG